MPPIFASRSFCPPPPPPPPPKKKKKKKLTISTILFRSCWVPFRKPHISVRRRSFCPLKLTKSIISFRSCWVQFWTSSGAPLLNFIQSNAMERMANKRLVWYFTKNGVLAKPSCDYRENGSSSPLNFNSSHFHPKPTFSYCFLLLTKGLCHHFEVWYSPTFTRHGLARKLIHFYL